MLGFEDLLTRHLADLWRVAHRLCNYNQANAEDLLQDAMMRAFNGRESLMKADNQYAWLRRVVVNTFLNTVRNTKKWRMTREVVETDSVADAYEGVPSSVIDAVKEDLWNDDIAKALNLLPESSRTLFLLSDIEGYTHDELAELFELPEGTVSSRVYRTRVKLVKLLEQYALEQGYLSRAKIETERKEMRDAMAQCADRARLEAAAIEELKAST